ncbi:hypothetical protein [[Phormidium] sp. ETS-05]|uniref:hypothetical protein n=1 Tax=[Phormidium] sp. ETS-05 TaxID=222819 RepID=UPI0018EF10A2|nr:hypothetical protein [[Phormidium] sp. ETS-05]
MGKAISTLSKGRSSLSALAGISGGMATATVVRSFSHIKSSSRVGSAEPTHLFTVAVVAKATLRT